MSRSALLKGLPIALAALLAQSVVAASGETVAETLLSHQKPTTTSSVENATFGGGLAVDGDTTTRWASAEGSDPQWIAVDLGGPARITRVKLNWEAAHASAYQLQVSADGSAWTTVKSVTGSDGAIDELTGLDAAARHVRVLGTQRATSYGYSLWELEVHGSRTGGGDIEAPSAPSGLKATSATTDAITLAWTPATDNVGVTGYEVLRNGNVVGTSTTAGFTDTNLASGTTFTYAVRARDAAGNLSAPSASVQASTQPGNGTGGTVFVIAGDIAKRELPSEHSKTAELVAGIKPQHVLTVGDNQYDNGTLSEFRAYYDKTWGKFKSITKPTPGNHEWYDQLKGYKAYFGSIATPQGKPYYSFDVGDFHFVALDSDPVTDGNHAEQVTWLKQDLAKNTKSCVVGYWHHPRFNSGEYGDNKAIAPLWDEMVKARADVVFGGHDHHYERIKPLNSQGRVDEANGVRSAIVGIGGDSLYTQIKPRDGVEKSFAKHGVMKFVTSGKTYSWEIIGTDGKLLDKAGPYTCR
ncbi:discoidin domain-containing protein [Amycolatopsis albispora]|uniref:Alkaline phosphatase n=1 Tax=Amycolatopsis albispora TaxID=1804986 RepID=A0A344L6I5_9PSEU|nr:discoidin domain-containing protein [Amycolatopsis albispora]AXB43659.1 alkaline phosphatase [Amycolatopsis albispora]